MQTKQKRELVSHPVRSIKVSDKTWEKFKKKKLKFGKSWNQFISKLLDKYDRNSAIIENS